MRFREFNRETGKYNLVQAHQIINPRPFIWVDNVATKNYKPEHWEQLNVPHLIIRPNKRFGITEDHMAQMNEFVANIRTNI